MPSPAALTPFKNDYLIGSGEVLFTPEGENGAIILGNTPGFNLSVTGETYSHTESSTALKATDFTRPISSTVGASIECDSLTTSNLGLIFGSNVETVSQSSTPITGEVIAGVKAVRVYQLGRAEATPMGVQRVTAVTLALTGPARANSTAYAVGAQIVVSDKVFRASVAGTSASSAPLFAGTTIGDTTTDGGVTWVYIAATAALTLDTDYKLDPTNANFAAMPTGKIATALALASVVGGVSVTAAYTPTAGTRSRISSGTGSVAKGELRFISDNASGENRVVVFPSCTLSPSGDISLISTEPSPFTFDVGASKLNSSTALLIIDGRIAA